MAVKQFFAPCRNNSCSDILRDTKAISRKMDAPKALRESVEGMATYIPTLAMELRNAGIVVEDPNNAYEVILKYGQIHPEFDSPSEEDVEKAMRPKSGFDFGGMFGALGDIVNGIIAGVSGAEVQAFLQNWARQFQQYMTDDITHIQNTLSANASAPGVWGGWGAYGALDMLLRFKKTSWRNLKNTITDYCSSKSQPIPPAVESLWQDQADLEANLRNMIMSNVNLGARNTTDSSGENLGGPHGSAPIGGSTPGGGLPINFDFKKWLPWIIGVVVFIIIIILIFSLAGKKNKN